MPLGTECSGYLEVDQVVEGLAHQLGDELTGAGALHELSQRGGSRI
jgi:hypothetical protein